MQVHPDCHNPKMNKQVFSGGPFFYLDGPHFLNTEGGVETTEVRKKGSMGRGDHSSSLPQSQLGLCKQLCQFLTTINMSIRLLKITSLLWVHVHTSQACYCGQFSIGIDSWCTPNTFPLPPAPCGSVILDIAVMERLKETLLKRDEKGLTLCLDSA